MILEENPKKKYGNKFTPKQKKEYKGKKEKEKKELIELYESFLEKKIIKEIVGIISDYKQMHDYSFNYSNVWLSRIKDTFDFKEFEKCYKKISSFIEKLNFSNNNGGGARK